MGALGDMMGLSIFRTAAIFLLITTLIGGGFSFVQTRRLDSYQAENTLLKKQLIEARKDIVEMIDAYKANDPQVDVLRRHEQKMMDLCKEMIRGMDGEGAK